VNVTRGPSEEKAWTARNDVGRASVAGERANPSARRVDWRSRDVRTSSKASSGSAWMRRLRSRMSALRLSTAWAILAFMSIIGRGV
jgi:hypothetical protein